jgi:hypothetical protein
MIIFTRSRVHPGPCENSISIRNGCNIAASRAAKIGQSPARQCIILVANSRSPMSGVRCRRSAIRRCSSDSWLLLAGAAPALRKASLTTNTEWSRNDSDRNSQKRIVTSPTGGGDRQRLVVESAKRLSKVASIDQTNDVMSINCECRFWA